VGAVVCLTLLSSSGALHRCVSVGVARATADQRPDAVVTLGSQSGRPPVPVMAAAEAMWLSVRCDKDAAVILVVAEARYACVLAVLPMFASRLLHCSAPRRHFAAATAPCDVAESVSPRCFRRAAGGQGPSSNSA
jgi:hypothetical protein